MASYDGAEIIEIFEGGSIARLKAMPPQPPGMSSMGMADKPSRDWHQSNERDGEICARRHHTAISDARDVIIIEVYRHAILSSSMMPYFMEAFPQYAGSIMRIATLLFICYLLMHIIYELPLKVIIETPTSTISVEMRVSTARFLCGLIAALLRPDFDPACFGAASARACISTSVM